MLLEGFKTITIYDVEKLKEVFLKIFPIDSELSIDMSSISKVDMVGIQLLISLVRSVNESKQSIKFENITQNVLRQIKESRCGEALGIEV